ncbi:hypothetical protein D0Z07_3650 [Hyphodiscus hymeniophilus]|uniref:Uncharacterized protein n=1 Tax=Hyphodiscus hymeniophilus TaxID=353542 RepID=A0A9P6VKH1_9HELO|nr:hypothetical protein D0Z07_3650 [Hyphodiscus hymeniophilus]
MRVGLDPAITVNLLLLAGWSGISTANILHHIPKNNPLNIDWDPAPSPEDGPPLSAGALRNPAYLPAEIGGIVGAYIFSVCIVGLAIILIGRKLRRQVSQAAKALDIEMVEPRTQAYYNGASPVTPGGGHPASPRNFSWPSPEKSDRNPYIFPTTGGKSPHGADSFVDRRIVEADQEMLQRDLEDIYAHVMEQEEAKAAGVKVAEMPPPPPLQSASPPLPPDRSTTPKKIEKSRPANIDIDEPRSKNPSRASSLISSLKSPKRRGIRGLLISSPIPTPISTTFTSPGDDDEEPLSPRYYAPAPPPPVPKDQVPYTHVRKTSQSSPVSPTRSIAEQLSPYGTQQFHRPNPSQTSVHSRDPASASSATSQTPLFPAQSLRQPPYPNKSTSTVNLPPSNNSSVRQLPLRQFEPAIQSPSFSYTTKTTVLERQNPLSPGLTTGGGPRTPWSAGATPYSPYQPFSPMMPITPRLVTKQDRKMMKKMQPRTPTLEMIQSEDDLFDSAY